MPVAPGSLRNTRLQILSRSALENSHLPTMALAASLGAAGAGAGPALPAGKIRKSESRTARRTMFTIQSASYSTLPRRLHAVRTPATQSILADQLRNFVAINAFWAAFRGPARSA